MNRLSSSIIYCVFAMFFTIVPTISWSLDSATSVAGVDLIDFPSNKQLFPRNINTNQASISITGKVYDYSSYEQIRLKIYRDGDLYNTLEQNLIYNGNQANFSFTVNITAELKNYDIEVWGVDNGSESIEALASEIVAGDVYVINGQSNAQANSAHHPSDFDTFMRSYTDLSDWQYINQSLPGQWGARMGKEIIDTHNIPVAIFNEAEGGQEIEYFLKNDSNPNSGNYGQLLNLLEDAEVIDDIRAIFWFQGEADGWQLSTEQYKDDFIDLYNDWKDDYNPEKFYMFQIRRLACTHPNPFVLEAQRQLGNDLSDLETMSTNNANHDGCHFDYEEGYEWLGDRIYGLLAKDMYDQSSYEVRAPDVADASISGNQIIIEMEDAAGLNVIGNPWPDFDLGTSSASITGGYISGSNIHLQVSGSINNVSGVSYYGHPGNANDWITNTSGVGLLSWHDFPVEGGTPTGGNDPDCDNISISTNNNTIILAGLDEAPIVKVQIFNSSWSQVFSCTNNCDETETLILPEGEYHVFVKLYDSSWSQICEVYENLILESGGGIIDNDNDGVAEGDDCDDNDPTLPAQPGSSCNDGNSSTANDVIQSDGCTCEGTAIVGNEVDCDAIVIEETSTGLSLSNVAQTPIHSVKIFNADWQTVYDCLNCASTQNIPLENGTYHIRIKLYDDSWTKLCERAETIELNNDDEEPEPPSGEIDCDDAVITLSAGQIEVSGLNAAPISKLKIFNSNWSSVFTCFGDCDDTETINLPEGTYHISIRFFNESWSEICSRDETVELTDEGDNPEPPSNGVDLELNLTADVAEFEQWEYVNYTLTLENNGTATANGILIDFELPEGTAYSSHIASAGTYSSWSGEWIIDQIGAGQSVVLQLKSFVTTEEASLFAFAQVEDVNEVDLDSTPGNNSNGVPSEDDETAVTLSATNRSDDSQIQIAFDQNRFLLLENIFPNPASNDLNLQISASEDSDLPLRIYNVAGEMKEAYSIELVEGFNQIRLDVSGLPSGIYTVLFVSENGHAPVRFVKVGL